MTGHGYPTGEHDDPSWSPEGVIVVCPYCAEAVEIFVEEDVSGEMVQDCDVCCNPWRLRVRREHECTRVDIDRLDD